MDDVALTGVAPAQPARIAGLERAVTKLLAGEVRFVGCFFEGVETRTILLSEGTIRRVSLPTVIDGRLISTLVDLAEIDVEVLKTFLRTCVL